MSEIEEKPIRIPMRYYGTAVALLADFGVDQNSVILAAGVDPASILDEDATVTLEQVETLLDVLSNDIDLAALASALALNLKLSSHGVLGFGLLSSPSFGYALSLACRYFRLIMPMFEMRYRQRENEVVVELFPLAKLSDKSKLFHVQAIAYAWHHQARELLSDKVPEYNMYLSVPPSKGDEVQRLEEATMNFNWVNEDRSPAASLLKIVYPQFIVNRSLSLANSSALKDAEISCDNLMRERGSEHRISEWVKLSLQESKDDLPTQQALAAMLNISPRTLDRSLKLEGLSFRGLAQKIRFERACEALKNTDMTVLDISLELGYSDSSNFTRAFRRQAKCSPTKWREDNR